MSEYFGALRQGHVVEFAAPSPHEGTYVVVSQSCDVTLPSWKREYIQLARLISIEDPDMRRGALGQDNPRYPVVTVAPDALFADLAQIVSVLKEEIREFVATDGVWLMGRNEARRFGIAVGRWFGRFAIPDEIQPWLAPLQKDIRAKYSSPTSNLGRVLQRVSEIRVEASSWDVFPTDLTLHIIVRAGEIPEDDELADVELPLAIDVSKPLALDDACAKLLRANDRIERFAAWDAVAQALAAKCRPKGPAATDATVQEAVRDVGAELWSDDDFPLSRIHKSEELDIEFLSDPAPLDGSDPVGV